MIRLSYNRCVLDNKEMSMNLGNRISRHSTILKKGRCLLNKVVDLLPVEVHNPGDCRYCGPGTSLNETLWRADPVINTLDEAYKQHDIAYAKYSDDKTMNNPDRILANKAWKRAKSSNADLAERVAAWAVTTAMNVKSKMGREHKRLRRDRRKARASGFHKKTTKKTGSAHRRRRGRRKTGKRLYLRPYPYA